MRNLPELAREVMTQYDFAAGEIEVIQGQVPKTVWKISNGADRRCLKRLRPKKKLDFTTGAQYYLTLTKAKTPAIYKTVHGGLTANYNNEIFALYDWIEGRTYGMNTAKGLRYGLQGLAEFHRDSTGYQPVPGTTESSKLGRWPEQYQSIQARLLAWETQAQANSDDPALQYFSREVSHFLSMAEAALLLLEKSAYHNWVQEVQTARPLCHQDYGEGNFVVTGQGVYVLDLDDVTFDLPIRDLRKVINKAMASRGIWDRELLNLILESYQCHHPLTPEQQQVLFIDLYFPHLFHDIAKNPFRKGKPLQLAKLSGAVKLEQSKLKLLKELLKITP